MKRLSNYQICLVALLGIGSGVSLGVTVVPSPAFALSCGEPDAVNAAVAQNGAPSQDASLWEGSSIALYGETFWLVSSRGDRLGYWPIERKDPK